MDADVKQRALAAIDVEGADWKRYDSTGAVQVARVAHEGDTYVLLRAEASDPPGVVLIFDEDEWRAFRAGVRDGEFG